MVDKEKVRVIGKPPFHDIQMTAGLYVNFSGQPKSLWSASRILSSL
jgi:hypothetical protein